MAEKLEDEDMDVGTNPFIDGFQLYRLRDSNGHQSTLLHAPASSDKTGSANANTLNILMADVSGSMHMAWPLVITAWNKYIKDKLTGSTKMFKFSCSVTFLRSEPILYHTDTVSGGTNITAALAKVSEEVNCCRQEFVRVFIVTDGDHTDGHPFPEEEINKMAVPAGKTVNVYLLGITNRFPVNYSIDIRSRLHNGSANMPSLYWARDASEIDEQMSDIGDDLQMSAIAMTLNFAGYVLPGLGSTHKIHSNEWLYFPCPPEEMAGLKVTIDSEEWEIPPDIIEANVPILIEHVFPQWNSVLIQQHRKKLNVPKEVFSLMDSLFSAYMSKVESDVAVRSSVRDRLHKKDFRTYKLQYATLMNMSRSVIEVEGKYANEIELANNILKSTVSGRKYDTKNLKLRGHGISDFERDRSDFHKIYNKVRKEIMALPEPHPEECCRITMSSTLLDLQDEEFSLMMNVEKYELLKNFTMTGIPAYAPVRDASQISVWTLNIWHMLVTPFTILSQRAIEEKMGMEVTDNSLGFDNKDVLMTDGDEKSRFNIIIPLVPASACKVLKSVVRSNLYSMMATFCILKNPHIIDHSAHLAALGCAWVRSIAEHPPDRRPTYVTERLAAIAVTAELYMDRRTVVKYLSVISTEPQEALMTESKKTYDEQTIKCESLVKPLFFLGLKRDKVPKMRLFLPVLLAEFIGRCLSNYKTSESNATPFTDFFASELKDPQKKEEWLTKASQSMVDEFAASHKNLLEEFYGPENVMKAIKRFINSKRASLSDNLFKTSSMDVNMEKVKNLRNVASSGDVRFYTFRAWGQEMGVPEEEIAAAYDPSQVLVYVCEALRFRNSRDRLSREPSSYAECLEEIKNQVNKENGKTILEDVKNKITEVTMNRWKKEYLTIHGQVVMPLTLEEVVAQAQTRNITVTVETFHQVYRYNKECKLLRNACQVPACPFYLVPNRRFNQHLAVERVSGEFPHALHLVSKEMCGGNVDEVVEEIITRSHIGRQGRKKIPISKSQPLQGMKTEIENLLQIYKQV